MGGTEHNRIEGARGATTLTATLLIALLGALWEWRRALRSDPFHYSDAESVGSALLIALGLFVVLALATWFAARIAGRQEWAPALVSVSFLFLAYLAWFSGRGTSVRSLTFAAGGILTAILAVGLALLMRRRAARGGFRVLLFVLLLGGTGFTLFEPGFLQRGETGGSDAEAGAGAVPPPGAPNLVLVTIDTFRSDFLGAYGNPAVRTPHMDRFARAGTQVVRALSSIPITLPSHATLMTGTHPATHGIYNNGFEFTRPERDVLAGHLRAIGYRTAAFVSAFPLHASFGLSAGFDVYDDDTDQAGFLTSYQFDKFLNESSTGAILERLGRSVISHRVAERSGEGVWSAARAWLDEQDDRPFFLWLHFYDPHAPYEPGETFEALYAGRPVLRGGAELEEIDVPSHARVQRATDIADYREFYAGEVTRVDRVIGEIDAYFDRRNWTDRTLFALTSDHGEGLGSHDVLAHTARVHEEQTSVPLFLRGPGVERGVLASAPVRLVDLAPTLLALGSLPPLPETDGRPVDLSGRDLEGAFLHVAETPVDGGRRAIENGEWKLIHALRDDSYELFHHARDPGETRDRIADREADDAYRSLRDLLASVPTGLGSGAGGDPANLSEAARERLRGLGYLNDD